ncbi:replication/maintenance protein RepL, partial [Escherichia coli]
NISQSELKVITYILEIMEYGNLISLNQSQIARDLDMKKSNMSVIFKKLTEKGVLIKEKGHLFMNSNLFAKGLNHKLNTERRENLKTAQFENDKFTRSF